MTVSLKAALLLGLSPALVAPALAQPTLAQGAAPARPAMRGEPMPPAVPPQTTAARPLAVYPQAVGPDRPVPVYRPDAGGPLSGSPYDRRAPVPAAVITVRTLAEAITAAYRTNPDLLAARAQARSADFRVAQARAAFGPNLAATGAYAFTRTRQERVPGDFTGDQGWSSTASLLLTQPVFTFGRNAAAEAGAVATSRYQRDLLRLNEADVLASVVAVYVGTLRDAAAVTIARENLALLERQLRDNDTRFKVRDLTATDLEQTRTRVELGRAQLVEAEGRLGTSQKQFLRFVGAAPGELAAPDMLDIKFGSLTDAYAYAEVNSALIRSAQSREQISRAAVVEARAEYLPRVDLRGTAQYGSVSPFTDRLRATQLVGQVVVSQQLFDSGLRRARVDAAREANQSDWRLVDSALRETRSAIGGAWDQLAASRTSLTSYRAAIVAAEQAYEGALLQERAGDRSTLDVLDLARDLLTVRNNYNVAVANEYLARSTLLAAAGLLEGPLIVPSLSAYDADDHYDQVKRRGDIPLITPLLSGLDGITNGDTKRDRAARDAAAQQALDETQPLPPATAITP